MPISDMVKDSVDTVMNPKTGRRLSITQKMIRDHGPTPWCKMCSVQCDLINEEISKQMAVCFMGSHSPACKGRFEAILAGEISHSCRVCRLRELKRLRDPTENSQTANQRPQKKRFRAHCEDAASEISTMYGSDQESDLSKSLTSDQESQTHPPAGNMALCLNLCARGNGVQESQTDPVACGVLSPAPEEDGAVQRLLEVWTINETQTKDRKPIKIENHAKIQYKPDGSIDTVVRTSKVCEE